MWNKCDKDIDHESFVLGVRAVIIGDFNCTTFKLGPGVRDFYWFEVQNKRLRKFGINHVDEVCN